MSCATLAPTVLVYVRTVQVIISSRRVGIASPAPFFIGSPGCDWTCVLSLHVAGHPEESIILLRLIVVASYRLGLVSVGVGLMSVLSMLSPLPTERL